MHYSTRNIQLTNNPPLATAKEKLAAHSKDQEKTYRTADLPITFLLHYIKFFKVIYFSYHVVLVCM